MRKNIQRQLHENALKPKHSNFFHKYAIFPHLRQPSDSQPHTPNSHTPFSLRLPRKAFSATRKSLFRAAKQPFPHHKTALSATKKSLFRNTKPPFPPTESKKMTHPNLFSQLSVLPRTFRKTYFTKKCCQYFYFRTTHFSFNTTLLPLRQTHHSARQTDNSCHASKPVPSRHRIPVSTHTAHYSDAKTPQRHSVPRTFPP